MLNNLPNTALVSCSLASARPIFFRLTSNKPKHIILSPIPDLLGGSKHAKLVNTLTARCLLPIVGRARADFFAEHCSFASSLASARPPLFCSLWPRPICFQCASLALQGFKSNIDLIGAAIASRNLKKNALSSFFPRCCYINLLHITRSGLSRPRPLLLLSVQFRVRPIGLLS